MYLLSNVSLILWVITVRISEVNRADWNLYSLSLKRLFLLRWSTTFLLIIASKILLMTPGRLMGLYCEATVDLIIDRTDIVVGINVINKLGGVTVTSVHCNWWKFLILYISYNILFFFLILDPNLLWQIRLKFLSSLHLTFKIVSQDLPYSVLIGVDRFPYSLDNTPTFIEQD